MVGGNIAITVDEEEYLKGFLEFAHSLIGREIFAKGDKPIKKEDLKWKLVEIWMIKEEI